MVASSIATPAATRATTRRRRVVRRLGAAARAAPPVVAPSLSPCEGLRAQSLFWIARCEELRLAGASLAELRGIEEGIAGVSGSLGKLQFPSTITTAMSSADAEQFATLAAAVVRVADSLEASDGDGCADLVTLSPLAYVIVAQLTWLAAQLMDRVDVSAESTVKKLVGSRDSIERLHKLLDASGLDEVLVPYVSAFELEPFQTLAAKPETNRSPEVYTELQQRAALLLAIKCRVATAALDGDSPDWPPQQPGTTPARTRSRATGGQP